MKNVLALGLLAACALCAGGCELEAVQADTAADSQQRVYTTGSNIGHRPSDGPDSRVTTVGREAAEDALNVRGTVPLPLPTGPH
jgi:hypothetical protein